jgi:tetratricopeptide (TPR) repeat protein
LLTALQQGRGTSADQLAWTLADLGLREEALRVGRGIPEYVLWALGDYPGALELVRAAARKFPDNRGAQVDLFLLLYQAGRVAEAAPLAPRLDQARKGGGLGPSEGLAVADVLRTAGRKEEAATWRELAGQQVEAKRRAGMVPLFLDADRARLAAYDGRDDEATALLAGFLDGVPWPRVELDLPLYAGLRGRPDDQAVLKRLDATLATQRAQVVELLCGPNRLSPTWQPAPETCAGTPRRP